MAALLAWYGRTLRAEILASVGVLLIALGVLKPALLARPNAWWWRFARAIGYVNARVLLTVMFAVVLVPLGLWWRLSGRDPLMRRRDAWPGWLPYPARYRDGQHYERMF
jgi:Saxitoxin biosynthesis operon protein SxtJ